MPQIRLYDTDASTVLATYNQIAGLTATFKLRTASTFRLEVPTQVENYSLFEKGRYIGFSSQPGEVADTHLFRIDQLERSVESDGIIMSGKDYSGIFAARLVVPASGQDYWAYSAVATETIAKGLVNYHAGPGAAAGRIIPNLTIEADAARGPTMTVSGRYQTVAALLEEVLTFGGAGYQVVRDGADFEFQYLPGTDRSASVFLSLDAQSVIEQSWLQTDQARRTYLYIGGQGDLADRLIVERFPQADPAPTGLARLEAFVDARDLPEDATDQMLERGDRILESMATENTYRATLHQYGSYRYGEHFFLGDIVALRNAVWGLSTTVRVVSATLAWQESDEPDVSIELDRPWPTIKDRIVQDAYGTSTVAASGAVDYHPQYHGTEHLPGGSDPYVHATTHHVGGGDALVQTPISQTFNSQAANAIGYTTVSGSSVTLPKIGYWLVHLTIEWNWAPASDGGTAHSRLVLNGSQQGPPNRDPFVTVGNRIMTQTRTYRVYVSDPTHQVSAGVYDNSGGNASSGTNSGLVAQWVSN
jgi:hypothetical protein